MPLRMVKKYNEVLQLVRSRLSNPTREQLAKLGNSWRSQLLQDVNEKLARRILINALGMELPKRRTLVGIFGINARWEPGATVIAPLSPESTDLYAASFEVRFDFDARVSARAFCVLWKQDGQQMIENLAEPVELSTPLPGE